MESHFGPHFGQQLFPSDMNFEIASILEAIAQSFNSDSGLCCQDPAICAARNQNKIRKCIWV